MAADTLLHNYNSYSKTLENVIENQDIIKDLKKLKILTLIVYGDQDKRVNIQNIQRLVQFNNRVKIIALKDLGHQLPLFQPDLVANLIN
ncbi:alpha/beta hydrolase [Candidatus Daviesbacteria bacterium]|nr:alpha/beta hydrolase [Candidatus Daviesbacteria bacterium]